MKLNFPTQNLADLDLTGYPFLNAVIHEPLRIDSGFSLKRGHGPRFLSEADAPLAERYEREIVCEYLDAWVRSQLYHDRGVARDAARLTEITGEIRPLREDSHGALVDPIRIVKDEGECCYAVISEKWQAAPNQWKFFIFPKSIVLYSRWERQVEDNRIGFNLITKLKVPSSSFYLERFERAVNS